MCAPSPLTPNWLPFLEWYYVVTISKWQLIFITYQQLLLVNSSHQQVLVVTEVVMIRYQRILVTAGFSKAIVTSSHCFLLVNARSCKQLIPQQLLVVTTSFQQLQVTYCSINDFPNKCTTIYSYLLIASQLFERKITALCLYVPPLT